MNKIKFLIFVDIFNKLLLIGFLTYLITHYEISYIWLAVFIFQILIYEKLNKTIYKAIYYKKNE